jgi:radical SAM protein with 4Fe4S-binding SPASM domain
MLINKSIAKKFKKSTAGRYKLLCYAPFNTLRFNEDGNVTTCCLNTEDVLGNLFENSLTEIINGEERKSLQKRIKSRDLPEGCRFCTDDFLNENFDDVASKWYPPVRIKHNMPVNLEFKTSLKCNLNCIMCSNSYRVNNNQESNYYKYGQSFRNEIRELIPNLVNTTFNGGEPLIIDLYYDIWEDIIRINPKSLITVHTSLSVLPLRFKQLLEKGNFRIVASIDSFVPDVYENIRQNAKFSTVKSNLEYIQSKHENAIGLNFCPMVTNWEEIPDFITYCNTHKMEFNFSIVYFPFTESLFNASPKTYNERLRYLKNAYNNMPEGENNLKLKSFIIRLEYYQEHVIKNHQYYISKEKLITYLSELDKTNVLLKKQVMLLSKQIKPGIYLNLFKAFGGNHQSRVINILTEMNDEDLIKNTQSLMRNKHYNA